MERHFEHELGQLKERLLAMGGLAEDRVRTAMLGLVERDRDLIEEVLGGDMPLNELHIEIDDLCLKLLALHSPMAADLRMLVTVLRVIHELERIGDLMAKVAKAARRLYPHEVEPKIRGLVDRMRDQAAAQLRLAIEAFADRDVAKAAALADMDDVMDELQKELFQAIFSLQSPDDSTLQLAVQIALVGRFYERAGDHAANVADRVQFMVTGHFSFETPNEDE